MFRPLQARVAFSFSHSLHRYFSVGSRGIIAVEAVKSGPRAATPKAATVADESCGTAPAADDDLSDMVPMVDPKSGAFDLSERGASEPENFSPAFPQTHYYLQANGADPPRAAARRSRHVSATGSAVGDARTLNDGAHTAMSILMAGYGS